MERLWAVIRLRWRSLTRRSAVEAELDEELAFHVDHAAERYTRAGWSPAEARRRALGDMRGLEARKDECRDTRGFLVLRETVRDVRLAGRTLRRRPGFALLVVAVLALGIGATCSMFSIVYGALWRPLPFADADRLYVLSAAPEHSLFGRILGLTEAHYLNVRSNDRMFEAIATFSGNGDTATLTGRGDPTRVHLTSTTTEFFSVLQVPPQLGRSFVQGDEIDGRNRIAVISNRLWRQRFDASATVTGASIVLDGVPHVVIGVMPASFDFPVDADVWVPLAITLDAHNSSLRPAIGRLKRGVSRGQAQAELESLARVGDPAFGVGRDRWIAQVLPLQELLIGDSRRSLMIFACAIGLVLLIACANVAGLFLIRAAERDQELAIRAALGSSRARLIRQLLVESCVVSVAGGMAGLAVAYALLPALLALAPAGTIPRVSDIRVDSFALGLGVTLAVLIGLVAGIGPALRAVGRRDRVSGRTRTSTDRQDRLRGALIVVEIALSLILLAGAGLMVRSSLRLQAVDPGFRPDHVLTVTMDLPARYDTLARIQDFRQSVLSRLTALPGASAAASVNWLPFGGQVAYGDFTLDAGRTLPPDYMATKPVVSPRYFDTLGIRLLQGRDFNDRDRAGAPGVVIVSQTIAHDLWPGTTAVGQRVSMSDHPGPDDWLTIIGVVDDVRQMTLARPKDRTLYLPAAQATNLGWLRHVAFAVRTEGNAPDPAAAIRAAFHDVDPNEPPPDILSMSDRIHETTATPEFQTWLLVAFASMAMTLTLVGIYGVLAYAVSQRRREFGIRLALGANRVDILSLVAGRSVRLALGGILLGTAGALAATRVLTSWLFQVRPTDPATFISVIAFVVAAGLAAGVVPAWRAARVDPATALRAE